MGLEIERKYLLRSTDVIDALKAEGLVMEERAVTQVYTEVGAHHEIRLRKIGKTYIRTTKKGSGLVREEEEEVVDSKLFKLALNACLGTPIKKKRYTFKLRNYPCCIDIYEGELTNLVTLEVEFPSVTLANDFKMPQLIQQAIHAEVTEDERFKNRNLALYGSPLLDEPIGTILKRIDAFDVEHMPKLSLPSGINSNGGMRVIFYQLLRQILFHKEQFLQTSSNEALHQFRVNIRKSRSLLQSIEQIFEDNIAKRFIDALKVIATATNHKRDLDVFGEYLETLDDLEAEFILEEVERERMVEDDAMRVMMQGEMFENIMHEWAVVLKEDDVFFQGNFAEMPLKASAALALVRRLKKMDVKLSRLDEAVALENFHEVRIEFKRLRYLLEYFGHYFHSTLFDETMDAAKKMQTLFGTLQDRDVQREILEKLESRDEFCEDVVIVRGIEQLIEEINNDIYQIRTKILMKKRKLLEKQACCIEELNAYVMEKK